MAADIRYWEPTDEDIQRGSGMALDWLYGQKFDPSSPEDLQREVAAFLEIYLWILERQHREQS